MAALVSGSAAAIEIVLHEQGCAICAYSQFKTRVLHMNDLDTLPRDVFT
jgi:hypothetical protein